MPESIPSDRRAAARSARGGRATAGGRQLPDVNNPTEMQAFFLQEVQLGEEMMAEGWSPLFSFLLMCIFSFIVDNTISDLPAGHVISC